MRCTQRPKARARVELFYSAQNRQGATLAWQLKVCFRGGRWDFQGHMGIFAMRCTQRSKDHARVERSHNAQNREAAMLAWILKACFSYGRWDIQGHIVFACSLLRNARNAPWRARARARARVERSYIAQNREDATLAWHIFL